MGNWGTVVIPMLASMLILGAIGFAQVYADEVKPEAVGFWKNHPEAIDDALLSGSIDLGDTTVTTSSDAIAVLKNSKSKDQRDSLRAETLAAKLNIRAGADPLFTGTDITPTIVRAVELLGEHFDPDDPIDAKDPDRKEAQSLKDTLKEYNKSGKDGKGRK